MGRTGDINEYDAVQLNSTFNLFQYYSYYLIHQKLKHHEQWWPIFNEFPSTITTANLLLQFKLFISFITYILYLSKISLLLCKIILHKQKRMIDWAEMCSSLEVFMRRITWSLSFFIIIAAECFHPRWRTNSLVWHSCQQHNIRNWTVGLHTFTSGSKMIASSQSWSCLDKNRMSSFWWLCKLAYCFFICHIRQWTWVYYLETLCLKPVKFFCLKEKSSKNNK